MTEGVSSSYSNMIENNERPYSFSENKVDASEKKNPLARPEIEEKESEKQKKKKNRLPKNDASIISELKRNPMRSTLTIRDIAEDFDISYTKAMYLYKEANEDANGVAREYNLPDRNATVSYLV